MSQFDQYNEFEAPTANEPEIDVVKIVIAGGNTTYIPWEPGLTLGRALADGGVTAAPTARFYIGSDRINLNDVLSANVTVTSVGNVKGG